MSSPNNKTWTVVCFIAEDLVEAVPTKWITGDQCVWPAVTRDKLNILIKNCEFNSCWPSHKIKTFRNATYGEYLLARKKAATAENTSDLNTDTEVKGANGNKRSRKQKIMSSSESDDDDESKEIISNRQRLKLTKIPTPPVWTNDVAEMVGEVSVSNTPNQADKSSTPCFTPGQVHGGSNVGMSSQSNYSTPKRALKEITENLNNVVAASQSKINKSCCCNPQLLYNIQSLLVEINSKVGNCQRNRQTDEEFTNNILEKSALTFPMKDNENLELFENFLSIPENYSALVLFFSKLGGNNIYEFIRRCIGPLVADALAERFSYTGRKGKDSFGQLFLAKAVIDAGQKVHGEITRKEMEQKIGDWLRRAKERRVRTELKHK